MNYKVGLIGCGYVGEKRALALRKFRNAKLVGAADIDLKKAKELASRHPGCVYTNHWKKLVEDTNIDILIISTTNDMLAEITRKALKSGKHVLVEKPAGRNPDEIQKVISVYEKLGRKLKAKVGFNHRFHPAIEKAAEIIGSGNIGKPMFIRARYGHGGRPGYDREWRASRKKAGGGEMLDQGSHLVDLSRYFMGDFTKATGYCANFFWRMEVEDNCFALLKTGGGGVAQLHASCTQWKNIFSFEIFCPGGQLNIDGLGRSYGTETLTFYKMKPGMGVPDRFVWRFPGRDLSWEKEFRDLLDSITGNKEPNGSLYDALESMKLIYKIYAANRMK